MRLFRCALTLSLIALLAGVFAPVCFTEDVSDPASDVCAAVGHEPGEWVCAEPGIHTAVCLRCGEPLSEACSYAEEAFLPTQTSPGRIERTCTVCGNTWRDSFVPVTHVPGEWTVTKEATYTDSGERELRCARSTLRRRMEIAPTEFGPVRFKVSEGWGVTRRKAEYEDLAKIARETGLSLEEVRERVK